MVRDWPRDSLPRQASFHHAQQQQQQCFSPTTRHPSFQQERFVSDVYQRSDVFQQERCAVEFVANGRFDEAYDIHRRQPPMQIDEALRSHCGIGAKQYFVAALSEDGNAMTFFSPGQKLNHAIIRQFFDVGKFQQVLARIEAGADPILDDGYGYDSSISRNGSFGRLRSSDMRRNSIFDEWGSPARPGRKRPRPRHPINEDEDVPMTVSSRKGIKVGDSEAVWNFYEQRFKSCQQTACKLIAKAWVKAVEPKKQSTHPYTGSDEKAPDWWPKPWGPTKDDKVRHKEPDHLYKRERVHLLAHILRLVVEPNSKQHNDIQKLTLNVKKLEETTYEALSSFFMDNETNAKKRPYLSEIFKMARQEERYRNGEIDGSTEVYVMAENKVPENYASDHEDGPFVKEEEDQEVPRHKVNGHELPVIQTATTVSASAQPLHDGHGPFLDELPVRGSSFNAAMLPTGLSTEPHTFVGSNSITVADQAAIAAPNAAMALDMINSPHGPSRRPSVFSEYASPGSGPNNSIYAQGWQQPGSAGPAQPALYSYATSQGDHSQAAFISQSVPVSSNPSFLDSSFEESQRSEYDGTGPPIFRAGDMSHASVGQQLGYYVPPDGRSGIRVISQVVDGVSRSQI